MQFVSPAAWYSALAQSFSRICPFISDLKDLSDQIPFVRSQIQCHSFFSEFKFPSKRSPVSPHPQDFWTDYEQKRAGPGTQRRIMSAINKCRLSSLRDQFSPKSPDLARLVSISCKNAGAWLTTPPSNPSFFLADLQFSLSARLRLGLPPTDDVRVCLCRSSLSRDPPLPQLQTIE